MDGALFYVAEKEAFFENSMIYGTDVGIPCMAEAGSDRVLSEAASSALQEAKDAQSGR